MSKPEVSIIIPAFNEEKRLPSTLLELNKYLDEQKFSSEVIVVDDGSTDHTQNVVKPPVRLIRNEENHGKGFAVRQGMLAARGEYRIFMDADLSVPPKYIHSLIEELKNGHDVVIGSRVVPGAVVDATARPYRRVMGHIFNWLVRLLVVGKLYDTQCGFKAFRRVAAEQVFKKQKLEGFTFDVEVLYLSHRLGLKTAEIPVEWVDSESTKVRPVIDSSKMFYDLLWIRWMHRKMDSLETPTGES